MDANNSEYKIRLMNENDIKEALLVFASHGLTESPSAVSVFMECDANAFYVAVRNSDQKIIGVCSSPITSHSTAYFGIYAVLHEYQRKGVGMNLFNSCLKHIGERNSGLFGVEIMTPKYINQGFRVKGKHIVVYEGIPENLDILNKTIDGNLTIKQFDSTDNAFRDLLNNIILYDTKVHNYNREKLITLTLMNSNYYTLVALNSDNIVLGFGCIQTDINGHKMIRPVYADNDSIAEALIIRLIIEYKLAIDNHVYLFPLNTSKGCMILCDKLQLKLKSRNYELYTKFIPKINDQFIYSVHSVNFSL